MTMETLIHSANEMKREAHETQQPRPIGTIGEAASTAQRNDSLVQPINQRFPIKNIKPFTMRAFTRNVSERAIEIFSI